MELPPRDFADYHSCEPMPKRCSNHKECGQQEECIETLARGFNAGSPEWSSRDYIQLCREFHGYFRTK